MTELGEKQKIKLEEIKRILKQIKEKSSQLTFNVSLYHYIYIIHFKYSTEFKDYPPYSKIVDIIKEVTGKQSFTENAAKRHKSRLIEFGLVVHPVSYKVTEIVDYKVAYNQGKLDKDSHEKIDKIFELYDELIKSQEQCDTSFTTKQPSANTSLMFSSPKGFQNMPEPITTKRKNDEQLLAINLQSKLPASSTRDKSSQLPVLEAEPAYTSSTTFHKKVTLSNKDLSAAVENSKSIPDNNRKKRKQDSLTLFWKNFEQSKLQKTQGPLPTVADTAENTGALTNLVILQARKSTINEQAADFSEDEIDGFTIYSKP